MSKHRVIVLKIVAKQLTVSEAANEYGISRRQLHRLLARYRDGGLDAVEPRSRRPHSNPATTPDTIRDRILELRRALTGSGLDAGPVTITWHLEQEGLHAPSTSTIRRILHSVGMVIPEPRKRPKSSYIRFEADSPNETWQSDFTHWRLADGTDVEILNWLDDHSRFLLSCTAHQPVTGDDVVDHIPCSDRATRGSRLNADGQRTRLHSQVRRRTQRVRISPPHARSSTKERIPRPPANPGQDRTFPPNPETLARRETRSDNHPGTPTTTRSAPRALQRTPTPPQQRPAPPGTTYRATPKALPAAPREGHYRIRYDHVGDNGKMSLRRAGRMHHLGIGIEHRRKRILALIDETTVTIVHLDTGEIIATNDINPERSYWRNNKKEPGRWPGSS